MEYQLKKALQVYVKTETSGEYQPKDIIVVEFTGKKGLSTLKRLQDVIFKTFAEQNNGTTQSKEVAKESGDVTIDDVLSILEMTGASEKLFNEVTGALKAFATIGEAKLDEDLQNQMNIEDLDGLYQEVLKHFLLPKITSKMNNMKK